MSVTRTKTCDRCGKAPINDEYTLAVTVNEVLPDEGGWSTGHEVHKAFDYCQSCKQAILRDLLDFLRKKREVGAHVAPVEA